MQSVCDGLLRCVCSCFFQEDDIPEEVNIDDLIDLPNEKERVKKLHVCWPVWAFTLIRKRGSSEWVAFS